VKGKKTFKNYLISAGLIAAGVAYWSWTLDVIPDAFGGIIGFIDDGIISFVLGKSLLSIWKEGNSVWTTLSNVSKIKRKK
jgi:uncharacterized membrane protein YkvA (DUF1232 family)